MRSAPSVAAEVVTSGNKAGRRAPSRYALPSGQSTTFAEAIPP